MTKAKDDGPPDGQDRTAATPSAAGIDAKTAGSPGDIHLYIGARLRKAFDDVASQPVPDRFLQLMQDLDKA